MENLPSAIAAALEPLRALLSADGYALELIEASGSRVVAMITAGPDACAECLVPELIMRAHFEAALRTSLDTAPAEIVLIYPETA